MALHPDFPKSPHAILDPGIRWFPADEALRESSMEKLMPPLVASLRRKVKEFRDGGYVGAADTSKSPPQLVVQHAAPVADSSPRPHPLHLSRKAKGDLNTTSPSARPWRRSSICTTWWASRTSTI